jgi:multidrug resistance efflux pump
MAINARADITRPLTLGLIGLAVVSWLITFLLFIYRAEDQRDHRRQVRMMQANEAEVRAQLAQQASTSGTLSDLQASIAAAQQQAAHASQARDQVQAQLAPVQQSLLAVQQAAADATKNAEVQVQRLTELQGQVQPL